jgi:threonine efflux protein
MDFLIFAIAHLFAILSPGPAFIGMTNFSICYGFKKTVPFLLGLTVGNTILLVISFFGLSEIIFKFFILKIMFYILSGSYIFYFGIKIWNKKPPQKGIEIKSSKAFLTGFGIEISNPKSLIFTTSLIALTIKPDTAISFQILIFFWLVFMSFFYELVIAYSFSVFKNKIQKYLPLLNKIFGVLLLFFGARLIFFGLEFFY